VLEKSSVVGGAAITEEFAPGFSNSVASYTVSLLNPKVIADLELERYGLQIIERPASNFWPVDDQRGLLVPYCAAGRREAYAEFSAKDAARLDDYDAELGRAVSVLRDLITRTPPNAGGGILELIKAGAVGRRVLNLSLADQWLLVELFTASAADFLDRRFENDTVMATFAFDGIVGSYAAPSTPGTAYVLLHHCFGEVNGKIGHWGHAKGGMGAITKAMAQSAVASGAVIRTNAAVERVLVVGERANGVVLKTGETIKARAVAANVGPKLLFRDLVAEADLDATIRAPFLAIKTGSGSFRVNVALAELPDFICRPGKEVGPRHRSGIVIGPTMGYLERAYLDARAYGWSREPIVEMMISSTLDPSLAPSGKHVASLFVQHVAPHLPIGRSWSDTREKERSPISSSRRAQFQSSGTAPASAFAARSRNSLRSYRRRYFPLPIRARSALFGAPGFGLRQLPDADQRPLPLRIGRASGRRCHRGTRHERGARDRERSEPPPQGMVWVKWNSAQSFRCYVCSTFRRRARSTSIISASASTLSTASSRRCRFTCKSHAAGAVFI
jgi:phytoene dehydrogenase-like protein